MKRTELKRKTPMKRTGGLTRTGKPLKRTPLRKVSKKQAKSKREFKSGRRDIWCARCVARNKQDPTVPVRRAVDPSHRHSAAQRPDLKHLPSNRDDLCRPCHDWVEENPDEAEVEGWRQRTKYELVNSDPAAKTRRRLAEMTNNTQVSTKENQQP